jgi:hypothetical protein
MATDVVLQWVRASTLAVVLLVSGVAGHAAASGAAPTRSILLPLFVISVLAVRPFVGAPASSSRVIGLVVVGQALLHTALQLVGAPTAAHGSGSPMAMPMAAASGGTSMSHLMADRAGSSPLGMLLAHLAAGLLVALWLSAGERAAWTLLAVAAAPLVDAWLALWEAARPGAPAVLVVPSPLPGWETRQPLQSALWVGCGVSRRGPPRTSRA